MPIQWEAHGKGWIPLVGQYSVLRGSDHSCKFNSFISSCQPELPSTLTSQTFSEHLTIFVRNDHCLEWHTSEIKTHTASSSNSPVIIENWGNVYTQQSSLTNSVYHESLLLWLRVHGYLPPGRGELLQDPGPSHPTEQGRAGEGRDWRLSDCDCRSQAPLPGPA